MAVAALSTSALALATVPTAAPASAAGETQDAFARLVSRAKPEGQAAQGETAPQPGDIEIETSEETIDAPVADAGAETPAAPAVDKPVDLVAELQALFAFAGQIGVNVPAAAPMALGATAATPSATTPQSTPLITAKNTGAAAPIGTPTTPLVVTPAPVDNSAASNLPVASTTIVPGQPLQPGLAEMAAITRPADAVDNSPDGAENISLRRDIASIVASLKAAFHPAETSGAPLPPFAAQAAASPGGSLAAANPAMPNVVVPLVQPGPAAATPATTNTIAASVTASAAIAPSVDDGMTEQAAVTGTALRTPDHEARPATVKAEPQIASRTDPSVVSEAPDLAGAMASAPLADAPVAEGAEQPPAVATPVITPGSASAASVIPVAVTSTDWIAAPVADAASAAAPSQVDQTVTRHLDLARDTQWLDQLARDISQSVTRQNHMKFQLNPEHLGALTVEIANSAAGTTIKLSAETDQARAIIADAQPRLIAEVRAQGVRVAESHVDLNQQGNGGSAFAQNQQRQSSEDSKPFVRTQAVIRDDASDSAPREDGELYA